MTNQANAIHRVTDPPPRRSFLARFAAAVLGIILVLFPFAAGLGVVFSPLRRRRPARDGDALESAALVRVCPLEALPPDGVPRQFVATADVADAWTRSRGQRIGSLFLSRSESGSKPLVRAFTATCPHLGCAVEFDPSDDRFECPCHESAFAKDGEKLFGPSLRGLDPLQVKLIDTEGSTEVWVSFQRFHTGIAERIPLA